MFNTNTVARGRIMYYKALIEITLNKPVLSKLKVYPAEGHVAIADVHYGWKPDICEMSLF